MGRGGGERKGDHQKESRRKRSQSVEMDSLSMRPVTGSLQLFTKRNSPNILDLGLLFSFPCSLLYTVKTRPCGQVSRRQRETRRMD